MHFEARHFTEYVKSLFPSYFYQKVVLDVGGGDVNGNNRELFDNCEYHSNDVVEAPNVTIVCETGKLTFANGTFDTIISTECFEHDMYYAESLKNIVRMLKPGGLFVFTCASTGRPEHGTLRTTPMDSYTVQQTANIAWHNYYKNLTAEDVVSVLPCDEIFESFAFYYHPHAKDLYFYGLKRGCATRVPAFERQPYIIPIVAYAELAPTKTNC